MKRVVLVHQSSTIYINAITEEHIVGVEFPSRRKGFVMKIHTNLYCIANISPSSSYSAKVTKESQIGMIKDAMNSGAEVFVFDTEEEFKDWFRE